MTTDKRCGKLIAFEGIDGAGKFTQLHKVRNWLEDRGAVVGWSSEPNYEAPIGNFIGAILEHKSSRPSDPVEFQRLYVFDRAQDIVTSILPRISIGNNYLIERYALSTIAYGMLSGLSAEVFIDLHKQVLGSFLLWPDITVLIDISAEEAMRRISAGRDSTQLFEKHEVLERVRQHYLLLAEHSQFKNSTVVVDGRGSEDEVFERIRVELSKQFGFVE